MEIYKEEWKIPVDGEDNIYLKEKRQKSAEVGPAVLMVHGFNPLGHLAHYDIPVQGYSGMEWLAARGYDVFALDMRGFGRSSRPENVTAESNITDIATALHFISQEQALEKVSLLGGSYGGPLALACAARHPEHLERLVLMATTYKYVPAQLQGTRDAILKAADEHQLAYVPLPVTQEADATFVETGEDFLNWRFQVAQEADYTVPASPMRDFPLAPNTISAIVREVTIPTHIVLGEKDIFVSVEDNLALLADLGARRKSFVIVGNAGHALMYESRRNDMWKLVSAGLPNPDMNH